MMGGTKLGQKLTCPNASMGCKKDPLSTELKDHLLSSCFYRDVLCTGSNSVIKFNEWANYLRRTQFVWDNGRELTLGIPASSGMVFDFAGRNKVHGDDFILRMQLTNTVYYVWIAILGDETDAKKYFATISLYGIQRWPGNKATASWTLPVIPYHDIAVMEKDKASFGSMWREIFESATTFIRTRSIHQFNIRVDIAKTPDDFVFAKSISSSSINI